MYLPYKQVSGVARHCKEGAVAVDRDLPIRTAPCIFLSFSASMMALACNSDVAKIWLASLGEVGARWFRN